MLHIKHFNHKVQLLNRIRVLDFHMTNLTIDGFNGERSGCQLEKGLISTNDRNWRRAPVYSSS